MKKTLTDESIVRLIEGVSDRHILEAQENLTMPALGVSRDWLEQGVRLGLYDTATIERDGLEVAVVFYHVDQQNTLIVNFCYSLRPKLDLTACIELAFRRLAGNNGCERVQFVTKRGGAIRKALRMGYEICGVVIRRDLDKAGPSRAQLEQRNMESSSSSKESTSANQTATNQQVGTSGPDSAAFGANSSGNTSTVNISTTDEADLESSLNAAQNISGAAIAGNVDVTNNALNAGVLGLKNAAALAQSGLTTAGDIAGSAIASNNQVTGAAIASNSQVTGAAIASNTDIAGTSIAAADDELNQALSANGSALTGAETLAEQLGGSSIAAVSNIAGAAVAGQLAANTNANQLVSGAIQAVVNGNANSNATLQSVMNSFTGALEQSNLGANELAAGALDQEQQVVGGVYGVQVAPAQSDISDAGQILSNVPTSVKVIVGLAVVAFGIYALAKLKE